MNDPTEDPEDCLYVWGYHSEHTCEEELDHEFEHACVCGAFKP